MFLFSFFFYVYINSLGYKLFSYWVQADQITLSVFVDPENIVDFAQALSVSCVKRLDKSTRTVTGETGSAGMRI